MDDFALLGNDLFGDAIEQEGRGELQKKFTIPPFSILNAREGLRQERKRAWLALGIQSEVGRNRGLKGLATAYSVSRTSQSSSGLVRVAENAQQTKDETSIFDPVLCELAYTWFCPPGGQIIDPFAGGSVRGIVAHKLGYKYWGCDLRQEQIEANETQGQEICGDSGPVWACGDAMDELTILPDEYADFVFTCPPYGSLEVYSDDERDLSNMEHHTFIANYKRIILRACKKLKNNRFAAIVVGDFRDKKGNYRNFVSDTIAAFREQGLHLYNEVILVTAIGSLPIRITKQFDASRKIGKTHQNLLIFVKGDGKAATKAIIG